MIFGIRIGNILLTALFFCHLRQARQDWRKPERHSYPICSIVAARWMFAYALASNICSEVTSAIISLFYFLFLGQFRLGDLRIFQKRMGVGEGFFRLFLINQKDIIRNPSCQYPKECPDAYIAYEVYPTNYSDNCKKNTGDKKEDSNWFPEAKP